MPLNGRARRSTINGSPGDIPPTGVTMANGGAILVHDNQNFFPETAAFEKTNERIVAHELGHTLALGHGDGTDNDPADDAPASGYDQFWDPGRDEEPGSGSTPVFCDTPHTFMSSSACGDVSRDATTLQRDTAGAVARVYTGVNFDPPGVLIPGPSRGDSRTDLPGDAGAGPDIANAAVQENRENEVLSLLLSLYGLIGAGSSEYFLLVDTDGNPGSGGNLSSLPVSSSFSGAELVVRVKVDHPAGGAFLLTPTLWRASGTVFQQCTTALDIRCAEIRASLLEIAGAIDTPGPGEELPPQVDAHALHIEIPSSLAGTLSDKIRIQALSESGGATGGGGSDQLPDGPTDAAVPMIPVPPVFPTCFVTPDPAQKGNAVTVTAQGLLASRMAKVFVGDFRVGQGATDASGTTHITFEVPSEVEVGPRLVTVGIVGTALTADCLLTVSDFPDCNRNGIDDAVDVASGASPDADSSGEPDECEVSLLTWELSGTAQGGQVTLVLAGFTGSCMVTVPTNPGDSAEAVAGAMASAINGNACLSAQGITASGAPGGRFLQVRGFHLSEITADFDDPGLGHHMAHAVPTLSPWSVAVLTVLLAAMGMRSLARLRKR